MSQRKLRTLLIIGLSIHLVCNQPSSFARASAVLHDEPWNRDHVDQLPSDVRYFVVHMCRERPSAGHYLATYLNNAKAVRLHFEYLRCQSDRDFRVGDACLRKEFVAFGPPYRLARTYYGRCGN